MKNILVPTDFSANANNALDYAIELAKMDDADLIIFHAYQLPFISPEAGMAATAEQIDAIIEGAKKGIQKLAARVAAKKVRGSYLLMQGVAADAILQVITKKRINLVVMGTK